jgi:hypothetical protein
MSSLAEVLLTENVTGELPAALPLCHLFPSRHLSSVLVVGELVPRQCKVMGKDLLYFSYGGVFYRQKSMQTQYAAELPIAFVFSPALLHEICEVFPFDTGAMSANAFGQPWTEEFDGFEATFGVETKDALLTTSQLVHHLYGTNSDYVRGAAKPCCASAAPLLTTLHAFLSADLSSLGVDHRQRSIECLSEKAVPLGKHLLWVGFPEPVDGSSAGVLDELYKWTKPNVPEFWSYPYDKNFNPHSLGQALESAAKQQLIGRFLQIGQTVSYLTQSTETPVVNS